MSSTPLLLAVNIARDLREPLERALRAAFGIEFDGSVYSRPPIHPSLRPYNQGPQFTLVVVDLPVDAGTWRLEKILREPLLPEWMLPELLRHLNDALVVAVAPTAIMGAVRMEMRQLTGRDCMVVPRELGPTVENLAEALKACWAAWAPAPKRRVSLRDRLDPR